MGCDQARAGAARTRRLPLCAAALLAAFAPAAGPAEEAPDLSECFVCHGDSGTSPDPAIPSLGGQPEMFLLYQLVFFRDGQRKIEPMTTQMAGRSNAEVTAMAKALSELPAMNSDETSRDEGAFARGEAIAERKRCGACHLSDYSGARHVPRLAGQHEVYLVETMRKFRAGERIGIQAAMAEVPSGLDDAALQDLAHYFAHREG